MTPTTTCDPADGELRWFCSDCTFAETPASETRCRACSAFEPFFARRWQAASVLVLGAAYGNADAAFWGAVDPDYVAVGSGELGGVFPCAPVWQSKDWFGTPGFWDAPTPPRPRGGFDKVFVDRCVWNVLTSRGQDYFAQVVAFAAERLRRGGALALPSRSWETAQRSHWKLRFREKRGASARGPGAAVVVGGGYERTDAQGIAALVADGRFLISDGPPLRTHPDGTPNLVGRESWQLFHKVCE